MFISVRLPLSEEPFEYDLEESATVLALKLELEEEICFPPARQSLYLSGILLDTDSNEVQLKDLLEPFAKLNLDVDFILHLPKASGNEIDKKWLILGKEKNFKTIMLTPNMAADLTKYLPLKSKSIGISYAVEGSLDEKNRKFSVRVYDVSKEAKMLRLITDESLDAKIFQKIETDGEEQEIQGNSVEVFAEDQIGSGNKLDKALKITKIGYYITTAITSILELII